VRARHSESRTQTGNRHATRCEDAVEHVSQFATIEIGQIGLEPSDFLAHPDWFTLRADRDDWVRIATKILSPTMCDKPDIHLK